MIIERKDYKTINIPCDCGTEVIEITKWDDEDDDYIINFMIDSFSAGQSIFYILKHRLQLAWLALRKGNYIHQEICLTKEKLTELRDNISEFLKVEKNEIS